jgi:agmatinase
MTYDYVDSDAAFLRKDTKGSRHEMSYAGALSFLRRNYSRDLDGVDIAVSGVPYDGAVTNRPGCRLGPRAIRGASTELASLKAFPFGFDIFETLAVVDYGDCALDPHKPDTIVDAITDHARAILATDTKMLTFGGDHFVSYPLLRAHAEKHGPVALVQFDAHCDTWDDSGYTLNHGSMFLHAKKQNLLQVDKSIQVGLRSYNDTDHGFEILTSPWVFRNGIDAVLDAIHGRVGDTPCYITFDIDCLDPAFAPGTGTPVPGGLATWQALELIRGLEPLNMVGFDLVEVSPAYDHAEITAMAAANIAHDWLAVMAKKAGAKPQPVGKV